LHSVQRDRLNRTLKNSSSDIDVYSRVNDKQGNNLFSTDTQNKMSHNGTFFQKSKTDSPSFNVTRQSPIGTPKATFSPQTSHSQDFSTVFRSREYPMFNKTLGTKTQKTISSEDFKATKKSKNGIKRSCWIICSTK
jgi:hypothetical protein